jgi:hypothetical protein
VSYRLFIDDQSRFDYQLTKITQSTEFIEGLMSIQSQASELNSTIRTIKTQNDLRQEMEQIRRVVALALDKSLLESLL